jgi:hypothetical protein
MTTLYDQLDQTRLDAIKNEPSRGMTATSLGALGAAALCAIIAISPGIESMQDAIVYDAVITRTCYERHGLNFLGRWSCRSSLRQVGPGLLLMSCAFGKEKKTDFCEMADKVSAENDKNKASKP